MKKQGFEFLELAQARYLQVPVEREAGTFCKWLLYLPETAGHGIQASEAASRQHLQQLKGGAWEGGAGVRHVWCVAMTTEQRQALGLHKEKDGARHGCGVAGAFTSMGPSLA